MTYERGTIDQETAACPGTNYGVYSKTLLWMSTLPLSPSGAPPPVVPSKGLWENFADLCGAVPVVGPLLKFFLLTIAPDRLLFFFIGLFGVLTLVYVNWIPPSQEPESAWAWVKRSLTPREKPRNIVFTAVLYPMDWRRAYQRKLEEEGKAKRGNLAFSTSDLQSEVLPATPAFSLILTPVPGYDLTPEPFRVTKVSGSVLIEPLKWSKPSAGAALTISVPRCEKGDRLHVILLATYKTDLSPGPDLAALFHVSIP